MFGFAVPTLERGECSDTTGSCNPCSASSSLPLYAEARRRKHHEIEWFSAITLGDAQTSHHCGNREVSGSGATALLPVRRGDGRVLAQLCPAVVLDRHQHRGAAGRKESGKFGTEM